MNIARNLTVSLSLAIALVTMGCVGVAVSDSTIPQSEGSGEAAANGTTSHRNLTVAVVDANATWTPGTIEVTVQINGSLSQDGEPVAYESVGGVVNVTARHCWTCSTAPPDATKEVKRVYQERTSEEGRFSTWLGPFEYDASYLPVAPPAVWPHCSKTEIWAWGIVGWTSSEAPRDTDHVWKDLCTQTYP